MHKSQANRARIAERAQMRIIAAPIPPRPDLPPHTTGPVRRSRAVPMTRAQRDSTGSRSHWGLSATYYCPVEIDRRWAA
jgi:hypothetical protein